MKNILFLEDNYVQGAIGQHVLQMKFKDYRVIHCKNAKEGIEQFEINSDIKFIISDGDMGGGSNNVEALCEHMKGKEIPIIISSTQKYDELESDLVKQLS